MATTNKEIEGYLYEEEIRCKKKEDKDSIDLVYKMKNYQDTDNDDGLLLSINLLEGGEYIKIPAP